MILNYSKGDSMTRTVLSPDGLQVTAHGPLVEGFNDPLPIDQDPEGRIYIGEFGGRTVTVLEPLPMVPEPLGQWNYLAPAPSSTLDAASATLNDKLYMVGGKTSDGHTLDAFEYDPFRDSWTLIAPLPFDNAVENAAAASYGGKLYVFGGSTSAFSGAQNHAAFYNPVDDSWTTVSSMPTPRGGVTAQTLNGLIYVMGGMDDSGASLDTVEIYDPETDTWSTGPSLQTRRDNPGSAVLDGKIYVVGGRTREFDGSQTNHATVEVFEPATGWGFVAPMPTARRTMTVGTISGRLQVIGGENPVVAANEEYNPVTNSWRSITDIDTGRHGAAAGTIRGKIYVAGGGPFAGLFFTDEVEVFSY